MVLGCCIILNFRLWKLLWKNINPMQLISEGLPLLSDFEIITRHFPENNDIKIYPISDVHLGAAEHLAAEWDIFL